MELSTEVGLVITLSIEVFFNTQITGVGGEGYRQNYWQVITTVCDAVMQSSSHDYWFYIKSFNTYEITDLSIVPVTGHPISASLGSVCFLFSGTVGCSAS